MDNIEAIGMGIALAGIVVGVLGSPAAPLVMLIGGTLALFGKIGSMWADC